MSEIENKHRPQDDFNIPSYAEWRKEAERLLKGAPFEKIMLTKTYEDINLEPIYTESEHKEQVIKGVPGKAPFTRGLSHKSTWQISQDIQVSSLKEFNKILRYDLECGQNAIRLHLDQASMQGQDSDLADQNMVFKNGLPVSTIEDLDTIFKNIILADWPVYIKSGSAGISSAAFLIAYCKKHDIRFDTLNVAIETDPLFEWSKFGALNTTLVETFDEIALLTNWAVKNAPLMKTVNVDVSEYHNCGASASQELAILLATTLEYFRELDSRGITPEELVSHLSLNIGLGSQFFIEIAKIRALRIVWNRLLESLGVEENFRKTALHGKTSTWNKTVFDPHNNILRITTEAFAGVLGGCDSIHVGPFDEIYKQPDEFSRRVARNIQLILRDECHTDRIIDPAGGSWYLESLTRQLAEKAWEQFQEYEKAGGMIAILKNGIVQEQLVEMQNVRRTHFSGRRNKLIGVNVYPRQGESPQPQKSTDQEKKFKKRAELLQEFRTSGDINKHLEPLSKLTQLLESSSDQKMDAIIDAACSSATIGEINSTLRSGMRDTEVTIDPLQTGRLSESLEKLRISVIASEIQPVIFLANMGPLSQHKVRADFASSFFATAGYSTISGPGFDSIDSAVDEAQKAGADVVIICSTDAAYPNIVPELTGKLKQKLSNCLVYLAGYPKEYIEEFEKAGIDEFIHIRSRIYETLRTLSEKLGVLK